MRQTRFVAALIALFLAATLPLVAGGSAQASSGHTAVAEKGKTHVTINFAPHGSKSFSLYGKVKPKAKHKKATLLRATKLNGHYSKSRTTHTNKRGRYSFSGLKKEGYYVVKIGTGVSKAIHVCKGSCG
jgi:hypothetical protein